MAEDDVLPRYRVAKAEDAAAIKELFVNVLPIKYDEPYYEAIKQGLAKGHFPGKNGRMLSMIARKGKRVVGAIVVHTLNLREIRTPPAGGGKPQVTFDLLDSYDSSTETAYIMALGVAEDSRREGIASDLVFKAVRELLAQQMTVQAVFVHVRADDKAGSELMESMHFTAMGVVPRHYTVDGRSQDAVVWAQALSRAKLAVYVSPVAGARPDLTSDKLATMRRRPLPRWANDLLLQFFLPIAVVALLFGISYALVLLGPLKGISDASFLNPKAAAAKAAAKAAARILTPTPHADAGGAPSMWANDADANEEL